jgi:hypothetical protein
MQVDTIELAPGDTLAGRACKAEKHSNRTNRDVPSDARAYESGRALLLCMFPIVFLGLMAGRTGVR